MPDLTTSPSSIKRRGLMLILSSPSGAGKTTLATLLLKADSHIHPSISCTTRSKRPDEIDGVHYHFIDKDTFSKMIAEDAFIEYAEVFGQMYGTPRKFVEDHLKMGEDVLFAIDWQGHRSLKKAASEDVVSVFIFPPSKQELLNRLKKRAQDTIEVVRSRMEKANDELSHWEEYDYSIINRDIDDSLKKLLSILRAERLKKARRTGIKDFVTKLTAEDC